MRTTNMCMLYARIGTTATASRQNCVFVSILRHIEIENGTVMCVWSAMHTNFANVAKDVRVA